MTDINQLKKEQQPNFANPAAAEINSSIDLTPKMDNRSHEPAKMRVETEIAAAAQTQDEKAVAYYRQEVQRLAQQHAASTQEVIKQTFSNSAQMEIEQWQKELAELKPHAGASARALFLRKQLERAQAHAPQEQTANHSNLPEAIRNFFANLNGDGNRSGNAGE